MVLWDVSLINVDVFSGAVAKNIVDGVRFDILNFMVAVSVAAVIACGVHVVFYCCWHDKCVFVCFCVDS